jgi:hypothetical protein
MVPRVLFLNSHSHRGFSPVDKGFLKIKVTVSTVCLQVNNFAAKRKPLKMVPEFGMLRYHRAKATV